MIQRKKRSLGFILATVLACVLVNSAEAFDGEAGSQLLNAICSGDKAATSAALSAGGDPNMVGGGGASLLVYATKCKQLDIVKLLLSKGADPSLKGSETVAVVAVDVGRLDILKSLVERGARLTRPVDARNWDDILVAAARRGDYEVMKYLLAKGADPRASGLGNTTALQVASAKGDLRIMGLLLDAGADINHQEANGKTALMIACEEGHLQAVELLIQHGADPTIKDHASETAESLAKERKEPDKRLLLECLGDGSKK